jgi:hypothetical protein
MVWRIRMMVFLEKTFIREVREETRRKSKTVLKDSLRRAKTHDTASVFLAFLRALRG